MRVVIEADEQYKNMFLEIAQAIKAKITFQENDFWDELPEHVNEGILEGQEKVHSVEDVSAEYKTKDSSKTATDKKKNTYDPKFVSMVKEASESKNRTRIDPSNVWESL